MPGAWEQSWTADLFLTKETLYHWATQAFISHCIKLLMPSGGERRIRTFEGLAVRFTAWSRWPLGYLPMLELAIGLEPTTCWLQISCSTNWAMPAWVKRLIMWFYQIFVNRKHTRPNISPIIIIDKMSTLKKLEYVLCSNKRNFRGICGFSFWKFDHVIFTELIVIKHIFSTQ